MPVVPQNSDPDTEQVDIIEEVIGKRIQRCPSQSPIGIVVPFRICLNSPYGLFDLGEEPIRQQGPAFRFVMVEGGAQVAVEESVICDRRYLAAKPGFYLLPASGRIRIPLHLIDPSAGFQRSVIGIRKNGGKRPDQAGDQGSPLILRQFECASLNFRRIHMKRLADLLMLREPFLRGAGDHGATAKGFAEVRRWTSEGIHLHGSTPFWVKTARPMTPTLRVSPWRRLA